MSAFAPIVDELPAGYRWLTADEVDDWPSLPGVVQVIVGGTADDPWTDLAIPKRES